MLNTHSSIGTRTRSIHTSWTCDRHISCNIYRRVWECDDARPCWENIRAWFVSPAWFLVLRGPLQTESVQRANPLRRSLLWKYSKDSVECIPYCPVSTSIIYNTQKTFIFALIALPKHPLTSLFNSNSILLFAQNKTHTTNIFSTYYIQLWMKEKKCA